MEEIAEEFFDPDVEYEWPDGTGPTSSLGPGDS
jgi:hypothetical protein